MSCTRTVVEDAVADAQTCVSLKPDWAKGHMRLASSYQFLQRYVAARECMQKALSLEPTNAATKADLVNLEKRMQNALRTASRSSWRITPVTACGLDLLSQLKKMSGGVVYAHAQTMVELTNAVIRDNRTFFLDEGNYQKLQMLLPFEQARTKAVGPEVSISEAVETFRTSVKTGGWNVARPQISSSVRCTLMVGIMTSGMMGRNGDALPYLRRAVALIEAVTSQLYPNVGIEDRGVVLMPSFYRSCLVALLNYLSIGHAQSEDKAVFPASEILQYEAEGLTASMTVDHQYSVSFRQYDLAEAYAANGYIFSYRADVDTFNITDGKEALKNYLMAAASLPNDEPQKAVALYRAIHLSLRLGGFTYPQLKSFYNAAREIEAASEPVFPNVVKGLQDRALVTEWLKKDNSPDAGEGPGNGEVLVELGEFTDLIKEYKP
ncbi:hypothetical protein DFJ77DRAFT_548154 [Powellomyces hirtus]|nr:hypothetical protein DFJ77DRAFT_548154 [Powellomyces hirtus]